MPSFQYEQPKNLSDAVQLLGRLGEGARILAGGTDLLVQMRTGALALSAVVDVKQIAELGELHLGPDTIRIGAAVPCWDLGLNEELKSLLPGVIEAAELIGSMQIQGRATLGGNVCNASPAADTVPALIACEATATLVGAQGERRVAVEDLHEGPGQSVLAQDEILVRFDIPRPADGTRGAYLRFIPRGEMDIAVVGAGVNLSVDGSGQCTAARVALGAVAPTAIRVPAAEAALVGTRLDDAALDAAAAAASAAASPISDKRGTADYRRHVAGVMTRRSTSIAAERARGAS